MLRDILEWIIANKKDVPAMDKINRATYPFTSHYMNTILADADSYEKDDGESAA